MRLFVVEETGILNKRKCDNGCIYGMEVRQYTQNEGNVSNALNLNPKECK